MLNEMKFRDYTVYKKKRKNRRRRERELEEALGVYIINILRKVLKINKEKGRELRTHQEIHKEKKRTHIHTL